MIANKPIHSAVSLLHLSVSLFCFSLFFLFLLIDQRVFSFVSVYERKEFLSFAIVVCIGFVSFCGFVSWQTSFSQFSQLITYTVSLGFLLVSTTILSTGNFQSTGSMIVITLGLTPATFFFLLAFSKLSHSKIKVTNYNDSLDSDFLGSEKEQNLFTFWKPNRIVALTSLLFSILLFPTLLAAKAPIWSILIPFLFLVISITLGLFDKIGSQIFSFLSSISSIGLIGFYSVTIIDKLSTDTTQEPTYILVFVSVMVISIALSFWSIAMLLMSEEARKEWET